MNFQIDSESVEENVISVQTRSVSDPPPSDIDFKNKMAWVRTTLKIWRSALALISRIFNRMNSVIFSRLRPIYGCQNSEETFSSCELNSENFQNFGKVLRKSIYRVNPGILEKTQKVTSMIIFVTFASKMAIQACNQNENFTKFSLPI